jgi:hypothetical protein
MPHTSQATQLDAMYGDTAADNKAATGSRAASCVPSCRDHPSQPANWKNTYGNLQGNLMQEQTLAITRPACNVSQAATSCTQEQRLPDPEYVSVHSRGFETWHLLAHRSEPVPVLDLRRAAHLAEGARTTAPDLRSVNQACKNKQKRQGSHTQRQSPHQYSQVSPICSYKMISQ